MSFASMIAAWLCAPVTMPSAFEPGSFNLGVRLATQRKSLASVDRNCHVTLGRWFDGSKQVPTEYALWLSPDYLAREVGYFSKVSGWTDAECDSRWLQLRAAVGNRSLFVIRLATLERQDPLELWSFARVAPPKYESAVFSFTLESTRLKGEILDCYLEYSRRPHALARTTWFDKSALLESLRPNEVALREPSIPLGDNVAATYIVAVDLPDAATGKPLTVHAKVGSKMRTGTLRLLRG